MLTHSLFNKNQQGRDFIVGDIHGCLNELKALLAHVQFTDNDRLICTGDLIDRGPFSYDTIDFFRTQHNLYAVKGNHDQILSEFVLGNKSFELDYYVNCDTWFKSFIYADNMQENINYLKNLPHIISINDETKTMAHITHAGVSLPYDVTHEIRLMNILSDLELMERYNLASDNEVIVLKQKIKNVCLEDKDIIALNVHHNTDEMNFLWNRDAFYFDILDRQNHALLYVGHNGVTRPLQLGKTIYLDTSIAYAYSNDYTNGKLTLTELGSSVAYQCNRDMQISKCQIENYSESKPYLDFKTE